MIMENAILAMKEPLPEGFSWHAVNGQDLIDLAIPGSTGVPSGRKLAILDAAGSLGYAVTFDPTDGVPECTKKIAVAIAKSNSFKES